MFVVEKNKVYIKYYICNELQLKNMRAFFFLKSRQRTSAWDSVQLKEQKNKYYNSTVMNTFLNYIWLFNNCGF